MNPIVLIQGDITEMNVDAIVNAANPHLLPGGGVCGAIHDAAGPRLAEACEAIGEIHRGEAVITPGFDLKARYVIHAAGPVWRVGAEESCRELLSRAYRSALSEAAAHNVKTIAFPSISTGIYGFPVEEAAHIAIQTVFKYLKKFYLPEQVTFCLFDEKTYQAYQRAVEASYR